MPKFENISKFFNFIAGAIEEILWNDDGVFYEEVTCKPLTNFKAVFGIVR